VMPITAGAISVQQNKRDPDHCGVAADVSAFLRKSFKNDQIGIQEAQHESEPGLAMELGRGNRVESGLARERR
jgi:hypothetical protein